MECIRKEDADREYTIDTYIVDECNNPNLHYSINKIEEYIPQYQLQIHGFIWEVIIIDILKFLVTRPDDTVLVYLMKNESDNTYSFVNITRWHICPCRFQSIREAVADMDRLKEEGKIIRYEFTK